MRPPSWQKITGLARNPRQAFSLSRGNVELWANLVIITFAVAFMLWKGATFAVTLGTVFAIWAMLSVSLNLVVGFTGLLSIGHIGFFGVGAYTVAILTSTTAYENCEPVPYPPSVGPSSRPCPSRHRRRAVALL